MNNAHQTDDEQARLWNGPAGRGWVEARHVLEEMFKPFEDLLVQEVSEAAASRVLDVGCGTGATTLAVARALGPKGYCTGIDLSEPMIAAARARARLDGQPAGFICADAQTHAFAPATFDMIVSRLGVMFFADPVQAFANLRQSARPDARLRFIAWRAPAENPFMTTAERAARPLLPGLPERRSEGPGQFAFADRRRIASILAASDWTAIDIRPIDIACSFQRTELVRYLSWLGPVGLFLQGADESTRARVIKTVSAAFEPYVRGPVVSFTAACWMVAAQAPTEVMRG
ncbi:class I SAM-dependent methyltransferase [Bradyrhizobium australiense]|uniref:Class I SAM-dependent methyltransferase n=1 Tax=Bradyrhizobium australiense TaxID=2721161 RepID=A0A7Y4GZH8_9BRAD|nr:class I SAM-dependent methyltransferase [Bradyrhizobium australiense]NOJ44127.1 class I SAM-dependent methyltransferase [Bradyrhizobium australiense]